MHHTLVPSDRVEHACVFGLDGTKLGTIERLMLDKVSGTVAYAVIKTGGLLATHHHYPVRWDALRFDPRSSGFPGRADVGGAVRKARPSSMKRPSTGATARARTRIYWTV